jgi:hypothetical protein
VLAQVFTENANQFTKNFLNPFAKANPTALPKLKQLLYHFYSSIGY